MFFDATHKGASQEDIFRRLETGEGIHRPTYREVLALLGECSNINLSTFNLEGRKTLKQFVREARREAIICREAETGLAIRFARSVKVVISDLESQEVWIETARAGVPQERDHTVSETLHFGEDIYSGAIRGIQQELGITVRKDQFLEDLILEIPSDRHASSAFPGVVSIVRNFYVFCYTTELAKLVAQTGYHDIEDDNVTIRVERFRSADPPAVVP